MAISGGLVDGGGGGLVDGGSGGFHEEDHPRDSHGRFTGSGGGDTGGGGGPGSGAASELKEPAAGGGSGVAERAPTPSQKSILAKQTSRRVGRDVQRYSEEHCEPILARGIATGGISTRPLPDNEPADVEVTRDGKVTDGIELKTMTDNKNNKITVKRDALERKKKWMTDNQADFHTVVFDDQKVFNANGEGQHGADSDRVIYYKRGVGAFQVSAMHQCRDMAELRQLLDTPRADLPAKAAPPAWYVGQK